ncbi:MAG TPA: cyclic nucleotide-binding domain-containing protein, partial [Longimicrobium sp.]|nr:cyclic nucleotide-binding domain-containing protein [Longimicrobium sp.]
NLAKMFFTARDFGRAAKVYEMAQRHADAAKMYEHARDFAAAARCYVQAGEPLNAAQTFEKAGQLPQALELYEKAGAVEPKAECLARAKRFLDAARVYQQAGNVRAEVEMLRLVPVADGARPAAAKRLAQLYAQYGRNDDAANVLVEVLRGNEAARADRELYQVLLGLLERGGKSAQAAKVREALGRLQAGSAAEAAPAAPPAKDAAQAQPFDGYGFLKAIPIFAELSFEDMKDLYRLSREVSHPAGATLVEQGADAPGLHVILSGEVDVLSGDRALNSLQRGAFFGEISLIQKAPTSAKVVARTPMRGLFISRERFEEYLYTHETAALRIYRLFSHHLADRVRALSAPKAA